jgi:hypothetical protein
MNDAIRLEPTRPDAELAADFRKRMEEALTPVLLIMDEMKAAGFTPTYQVGLDYRQRFAITNLIIAKHFT